MTYVDERIVELRFDNKQFEQETAKTMSTLDKLKEKLQFKNASSGADQLQKAVANINVNPIIQGIDTIETKMSALSIAGKRIVENLVDFAMSGIHKVSQKLKTPINQIVSGGKARAQNIEQAKFQLEGLGVAWADIEEDISYGVQDTAYGLDAAAKVASQLVASQVELGDEMKHSLLGISGVAAMTNSSYEDIGRIYTTVAGNGRLMGDQLLQLSSRGINAAATLGKALNKTEAEIRDMVSKGQISFQMFSEAMFESFGEHAKSANKTFQGALSNTKAALSRLGADVAAQGFNSIRDILNEIIPKLKEFKKKIKPVEESIIKMVEAIGKLVEAFVKSVDIEGIVNKITPKIKGFIDTVTDWVTAYRQVFTGQDAAVRGNTAFIEEQKALGNLTKAAETASTATSNLSKVEQRHKDIAREIWEEGKYGTGEARREALGKDYEIVQEYIDEMIALGWDQEKMEEKLTKTAEEEQQAIENLAKTERKRNVVNKIRETLGNLKTVAKNVGESIKNVLVVAFDSIGEALSGSGGGLLDLLVILTGKLAEFSSKIAITKDKAQKLKPVFKVIVAAVKTLATVLVTVGKALLLAVGYITQFIKTIAQSSVVKKIANGIANSFIKLKDAAIKFYEVLKNSGVWDKFVDILKNIASFIGDRIVDAFGLLATVGSFVIGVLTDGFSFIADKIDIVTTKIKEGTEALKNFIVEDILHGSWLEKLKDLLSDIFDKGSSIFTTAYNFASNLVGGFISGLNSMNLNDFETASKIVAILGTAIASIKWLYSMAKVNNALSEFTGTFTGMLTSLNETIKKWGRKLDADAFATFADSIVKIIGSIVVMMFAMAYLGSKGIDSKELLDIIYWKILLIIGLVGALRILNTWLSKATVVTGKSITILGNAKTPTLALSLIAIGYAIGKIFDAILNVYNLRTSKDFDDGEWMTSLLLVVGVVAGLLLGLGLLSKNIKAISGYEGVAFALFSVSALIWAIGKAMNSIAKSIKKYGSGNVWQSFAMVEILIGTIGAIAIALTAVSGALKVDKIASNPFAGMFSMFVGLTILLRLAFIPLLKSLTDANKEGDAGIDAIGDLEDILKSLMIFIGALALIGTLASRTFTTKSGGSAVAKSGPLMAIAAIIVSFAALLYTLSKTFDSMKGLDKKKIHAFADMMTRLLGILGLMVVAVSIVGVIGSITKADIGIAGILLGLAAAILALAAVMAASAYAFKTFTEGIIELVTALPGLVDSVVEFFDKLEANEDKIVNGIKTFVRMFFEGLTAAFLGWMQGLILQVPMMVEALFEVLIETLNSLGDAFKKQGPEVVDAAENFAEGLTYFMALVFQKCKDAGQKLFRSLIDQIVAWGIEHSGTSKIWLKALGVEWDWQSDDIEDEMAEVLARRDAKIAEMAKEEVPSYYEQLEARYTANSAEKEAAKKAISDETLSLFGISEDNIKSTMGGLADKFKDKLVSSFASGDLNIGDLVSSIKTGDFSGMTDEFKEGFDINEFSSLWSDIDLTADGGAEQLENRLNELLSNTNGSFNAYSNTMNESLQNDTENLTAAMNERMTIVHSMSEDMVNESVNTIKGLEPEFYVAGKYCAEGFAMGLNDAEATEKTDKNMADVVRRGLHALAAEAKISSPSKKFAELGRYCILGFAQGIFSLSGAAEEATEGIGTTAINSLNDIIRNIYETTFNNMNTNPTITPVLDLSELEAGLGQMDQMFNNKSSYYMANGARNAFNSALASKNSMSIDETYDDTEIVEAVNGLRTDVEVLTNTLGSLGFYVDGRQMASAIADPMHKELNDIYVKTGRGVR